MNDPLWSLRVREDGDGSGVMTVGSHFCLGGMIVAWLMDDDFGDGKGRGGDFFEYLMLEWWWFFHNRVPRRESINLKGVRCVVIRIDETNDEDLILERDNLATLDGMSLNEKTWSDHK